MINILDDDLDHQWMSVIPAMRQMTTADAGLDIPLLRQVRMLRLEDDLFDRFSKSPRGNIGDTKLTWKKEAAACVVIAVDGYLEDFSKGREVTIDPINDASVTIFHAGTIPRNGKMINVAGRVVSVCANASTLSEALAKVLRSRARR